MNFVVVKITVLCSEQICSEFCSSEDHCSINSDVHYFQLSEHHYYNSIPCAYACVFSIKAVTYASVCYSENSATLKIYFHQTKCFHNCFTSFQALHKATS